MTHSVKHTNQPQKRHFLSKSWIGILLLAASLMAYAGMVGVHLQFGTLRDAHTLPTLFWYGLAFITYLGTLVWVDCRHGINLKFIFAGALLFRGLLLFTTPTLSDDVYRYIWDGHVAINGVSPYALPIESPALDYLDTPLRALANNAWMASPYLPAAQYLFAGLTVFFPPVPLTFQLAMLGLDLLNGVLLVKLLQITRLPPFRVLIYLWNPLIVVEVAHGAHIDTWMILLTLLALWLTFKTDPPKWSLFLAPAMLALATLTKGVPALLIAVLFWRWRWWQLLLYFGLTIGLLIPPGVQAGWGLTGPLDGTGLFGALRIYTTQWNFNSGLFHWIEGFLESWGVVEATQRAKLISGGVLGLTMIGVWLKARAVQSPRQDLRLMAIPFMAYILLTPTVHPWYLMILLAFLPFLPPSPTESRWRWLAITPWIYLSGALALSYLTYLDPLNFGELEWVRKIEWWPTLGLLLLWAVVAIATRQRKYQS